MVKNLFCNARFMEFKHKVFIVGNGKNNKDYVNTESMFT